MMRLGRIDVLGYRASGPYPATANLISKENTVQQNRLNKVETTCSVESQEVCVSDGFLMARRSGNQAAIATIY
jgi:hypothetical protein